MSRALRAAIVLALLLSALAVGVLQSVKRFERPLPVAVNVDYAAQAGDERALQDKRQPFDDQQRPQKADSLSPIGPSWLKLQVELPATPGGKTFELKLLRTPPGIFEVFAEADFRNPAARPLIVVRSRLAKGGIAIDIPDGVAGPIILIGNVSPNMVARVKASVWESESFALSELDFERSGGALAGTLFVLALFSAVIAILNGDRTYWIFAGWLITTYRVAAFNAGWDLTWLGIDIQPPWSLLIMRVTLAAHALLTVELFHSLFKREVKQGSQKTLAVLKVITAIQIPAAVVLPHVAFLTYFWASSGVGLLILLWLLGQILTHHPSRIAAWYTTSWAATFAGSLSEMAFTSGLIDWLPRGISVQTGAITSSIITAIALAERLRTERVARLRAQRRAVQALRTYRKQYNSTPVGLFTVDPAGLITKANPAFRRLLISGDVVSAPRLHWDELLGEGAFTQLMGCVASDAGPYEVARQRADGTKKIFSVQASRKAAGIDGFVSDVTVRKAAEARLRHLADHDPLTDLPNRRALERELARCNELVRGGGEAALAYIDLDRFKLVNDLFGHMAGDHVLRQIASRLKNALGPGHLLSRVGGDEFVVILFGCGLGQARTVCERLLSAVGDTPIQFADKAFSVTAGIGLVKLTTNLEPRDAIAACDRACADAKRHGGSHLVTYAEDGEELRKHLEEIKLVAIMRDEVPTDRLFVQLQPIVSLDRPFESLNYEVLARMRDEEGRTIPPGKFIAAAERNGAMAKIDRWVLATMIEWLYSESSRGMPPGFATINLSGASLNDERFIEDSISIVSAHPKIARQLCFEITESVALYDLRNTRRFVDRIKSLGSQVALDDFGAGYTSFNYLKQLPADLVKIDGEFIRSIDRHESNLAITRAIVDLCHHIGMKVVAEWVESSAALEILMKLGVDFGQGYALARPLDPAAVRSASSCGHLIQDHSVVQLLRDVQSSVVSLGARSTVIELAK